MNVARYSGYDILNKSPNLSGGAMTVKSAVFGATASGIADFGHPSSWDAGRGHTSRNRLYFRTTLGRRPVLFLM